LKYVSVKGWAARLGCPDRLRVFSLESALIECLPQYFASHATDARAAMATVRDASGLLAKLLEGGHSVIAGRLAAPFATAGVTSWPMKS
jgi:hypothetical protein